MFGSQETPKKKSHKSSSICVWQPRKSKVKPMNLLYSWFSSQKIKRTSHIKSHLLFRLLYSVFGCPKNQKEKLRLLHKETHETPNDLNPITPTKVQNSTTILPSRPNPIIPSKTANPPVKNSHQQNIEMREEMMGSMR